MSQIKSIIVTKLKTNKMNKNELIFYTIGFIFGCLAMYVIFKTK